MQVKFEYQIQLKSIRKIFTPIFSALPLQMDGGPPNIREIQAYC